MKLNEEFNKKIKEFYEKEHGQRITIFLKNNPDIDEYLSKIVEEIPWFQTKVVAFCLFSKGIYNIVKCAGCGKELDAKKVNKGRISCSGKCGRNNSISREKYEKTNLKRYGVKSPIQADGFYYQWDSYHGEWEKFNRNGRHLGAVSPDGEKATKDAVKTRRINI